MSSQWVPHQKKKKKKKRVNIQLQTSVHNAVIMNRRFKVNSDSYCRFNLENGKNVN